MPQSPDQLYSVHKTTIWFAVASIALVVTLVLIVFQDHNREWKTWQEEFVELERKKLKENLQAMHSKVDEKRLEDLRKELASAQEEFDRNKSEFEKLEADKTGLNVDLVKASARYEDLKQHYDSYKFFLEEHREQGEDEKAAQFERKFKGVESKLKDAKFKKEQIERKIEEIDARIFSFQSVKRRIEKEMNEFRRDEERLERKLKELEPSLIKDMINAPMVDFVAPTLEIQQVVLEDLHEDFHFAKAQRVDRCTTCHLAVDRAGFEDAPQPFRTHPRLDLFLSADSPHPLEKIGCTVCHGGSGQSLSFTWAAHTPQNKEQRKTWERKYDWHELEKWEAKMLPLQHIEASCAKCHGGVVNIPEAPKLNQGRALAQKYGCFGCHLVKGFENRWRVGPDLRNVRSKLDREWIVRWLQNPKAFRPSTQMPQAFHLENTNSEGDRRRSNAAIEGIATYLLKHSNTVSLESPPIPGSPEAGKKFVEETGCLGCHTMGDTSVNDHGPELVYLGSKVQDDWLYSWLKNPKHYSPETRMPNLRLTDEEAAHMTAYLLEDRNEQFDASVIPQVAADDLDGLAMGFLTRKMRQAEAQDQLRQMELEEKFEFVGEKMILQQGCFGCHTIRGFEEAKQIGTELTKEGQKEVERLDFGFVDIDRTRYDWFRQKLKNPRIFDRGKIKDYHEKLRMPHFGFTDEEAEALTTFLLSLRVEEIPLEMRKQLDLREQEIEAGRLLVSKLNCQGCHTLDGVDGRVRSLFSATLRGGSATSFGGEDVGKEPPVLDGEGAKVEEVWLYHFLRDPETIRPWLKYRMPTFDFTEEETNSLVKYFAYLDEQEISFLREKVKTKAATVAAGRELFTQFKCIQCHQGGETQTITASFLAPDLAMAKDRLKPAWVIEWLKDPQVLKRGTMMPTFFPDATTPLPAILGGNAEQQIKAIRDYLWTYRPEEVTEVKGGSS